MTVEIKICGLSEERTLEAAIAAGAEIVGLVSFPKSPRHVAPEQAATLSSLARGRARVALLTVDAGDSLLGETVAAVTPDILQLHGAETPERVKELRRRYDREIWKAVSIDEADDLRRAAPFWETADRVLFDARPPREATLPGGNGVPFDWRLLAALDPHRAFVLSGGLTPGNVAEAIRTTRARAVDVSSGVESAPGVKDAALIAAFVREARAAAA
ncbi:phosphoribosylanthranilate isomerase [Hansschlegelia zhihuaiae]|uniref:N-(5'-phosphoribosyl)anthranilate isomerase n=1 Tax=Hansschlegelia zhihuaiae TaxID=405005 RepID=A0A4Q0MIB5_9HYPH|nr:phosphoribosylanthranilate isomerase [Hansschlegelia zhihuaiae]RXF72736.1 phosphoribosylanthranilate isomerase [Hansschlegelia zhihuaiae]